MALHPATIYTNERSVYNNMPDVQSAEKIDLKCSELHSGWQLTKPTDQLPFKVTHCVLSGKFQQTSNKATAEGIEIGTVYWIRFVSECEYIIHYSSCPSQKGRYTYSRASDHSYTNSAGGNYHYAQLAFYPHTKSEPSWKLFLTAHGRNEGYLESLFGVATFTLKSSKDSAKTQ